MGSELWWDCLGYYLSEPNFFVPDFCWAMPLVYLPHYSKGFDLKVVCVLCGGFRCADFRQIDFIM